MKSTIVDYQNNKNHEFSKFSQKINEGLIWYNGCNMCVSNFFQNFGCEYFAKYTSGMTQIIGYVYDSTVLDAGIILAMNTSHFFSYGAE